MWARIAAMPPKAAASATPAAPAPAMEQEFTTPRIGAADSVLEPGNLDLSGEAEVAVAAALPLTSDTTSSASDSSSTTSPSSSSAHPPAVRRAKSPISTRIPVTPVNRQLQRRSTAAPKTAPANRGPRPALLSLSGNASTLRSARSERTMPPSTARRPTRSEASQIAAHAGHTASIFVERSSFFICDDDYEGDADLSDHDRDGTRASGAMAAIIASSKGKKKGAGAGASKHARGACRGPVQSFPANFFESSANGNGSHKTALCRAPSQKCEDAGLAVSTASTARVSGTSCTSYSKSNATMSSSKNDYAYLGSSVPTHASTPSKQVTLLKRINLVKQRYPVASPTMQSLRGKVLSPCSESRQQVQDTLIMFERRIALQDRAAAVLSLLKQAEREHVIGGRDASRLKRRVSSVVAWISLPNREWPQSVSSDGTARSFLEPRPLSKRNSLSPSQIPRADFDLILNGNDSEEAAQEQTLGALVEIESEVRQLRRIVLTGGGKGHGKIVNSDLSPVLATFPQNNAETTSGFSSLSDADATSISMAGPTPAIGLAPVRLDGALEHAAQHMLGESIDEAMEIRCQVVQRIREIVERYFVPVYGKARGPKPVLKPSGSFALGICDQSSDVDLVCVFPHSAGWNTFPDLARYLKSIQKDPTRVTGVDAPDVEIRHVSHIEQAAVPLISFDFVLRKHSQVDETVVKVDLLFVRLPIPAPLPAAHLLPLDDDAVLLGMDSASVKGLNGVRSAAMILSMVDSASAGNDAAVAPNISGTPLLTAQHGSRGVFLDALRIVRKWAKARQLYGFKYGFLGGISWAIMVGHIYSQMLLEAEEKQIFHTEVPFRRQLLRQSRGLSSSLKTDKLIEQSVSTPTSEKVGAPEAKDVNRYSGVDDAATMGFGSKMVEAREGDEREYTVSAAVRASLVGATPRRGGPKRVLEIVATRGVREDTNRRKSALEGGEADKTDEKTYSSPVPSQDSSSGDKALSSSPQARQTYSAPLHGVTAGAVVRAFFARMSTWDWPTPVQLCRYRNADSASFAVRPWNPLASKADRAHVMPVLTPVRPVQNTSTSVTSSTREVLRQEFWLAHCHLSRSAGVADLIATTAASMIEQHPQQTSQHQRQAEEETAKLALDSLKHLVGTTPFFAAHEMFIQVTLDVTPYLNAVAALEAAVAKRLAEKEKAQNHNKTRSEGTPTRKADMKALQEEAQMQDNLYNFITGSARKREEDARACHSGTEDKTESDGGNRSGVVQKAGSLVEKEERLHGFVTFVESRMRDLVCHLEQCPVDEEFTKQHPHQKPFIVHPFTRPFYEQLPEIYAAPSREASSPRSGDFGDSEGESERGSGGRAFPRAYFFLALKGMMLPSKKAVSAHAANWGEVVRSEYQFSGISSYSSSSSVSGGEDVPRQPPPAPHVDIRLVNWHSLPEVVFCAQNDSVQEVLSREQAASFREAQRMRMQMQMQMQMQQMQMHAHQMHVQHMQSQQQQQRVYQRRTSKSKGRAHQRRRKSEQAGAHSSGKTYKKQHSTGKKHHKHSNLEGGAGKKLHGSRRPKKQPWFSGGQSIESGPITSHHGQLNIHPEGKKGTGHFRRNSKLASKNNNDCGEGDDSHSATMQQKKKKKKKKKKWTKKNVVKAVYWPELA